MAKRRMVIGWQAAAVAVLLLAGSSYLQAQLCTTQSHMDPALRTTLAETALTVGAAVKSGDANAVKGLSAPDLAANFSATESLVRSTAGNLSGDTLRVTQVYELNATRRTAGDTSSADFACPLTGTGAETDFSISGLPPGDFAFAMVEAAGTRPWLLSMLLQREGTAWKVAGLYPRARTAAGHDGLWYWTAARQDAKAKQSLIAWLYYSEAESLLQPAPFVDTTNLDKLRTEQRSAAPPDLANGLSADSPLVLTGAGGAEFKITSLSTEPGADDKGLHLLMHISGTAGDNSAIRARSEAAARALLAAHPALKQAYSSIYVFADVPGGNAPVVSLPTGQVQ